LRSADLSLVNLECVISSRGTPWSKTFKMFHFRADPDAISVLKAASIDCVSLANNHTLDYGAEALHEMLGLLDRNSIAHSGAGMDLQQAARPAFLRAGRTRVGVVAITDNQPEWGAQDGVPGVNYLPLSLSGRYGERLKECIRAARAESDIVIASCHVGPHFRETPSHEYVSFAHRLIDMGADVYWGHSNHMPQGIEIYRGRPIMYDCGDFVDDYYIDEYYRNDLSFLFQLDIVDLKPARLELVPTKIWDFRANVAQAPDSDFAIERMVKKCSMLGTRAVVRGNKIMIAVK
jgi:poly-gamma-glutamate synthesis protein (capsule biosynthesis protein)